MNLSPPGPSTWSHGLSFPLLSYRARREPRAQHMIGVMLGLHCQADFILSHHGNTPSGTIWEAVSRSAWLGKTHIKPTHMAHTVARTGSVTGKELSLTAIALCFWLQFSPSLHYAFSTTVDFTLKTWNHNPSHTHYVLLVRCLVMSIGKVANMYVKGTKYQNGISNWVIQLLGDMRCPAFIACLLIARK